MRKNLKETTIAPGQLRQKLYYFYFFRIFYKKTILNVKNLEIQSRQVVRWEPMTITTKY
jgi:hypothetical protein